MANSVVRSNKSKPMSQRECKKINLKELEGTISDETVNEFIKIRKNKIK